MKEEQFRIPKYEPLPEIDEQIKFMRLAWDTLRQGKQLELTDSAMAEAILGTLCAARWIAKKC